MWVFSIIRLVRLAPDQQLPVQIRQHPFQKNSFFILFFTHIFQVTIQ